MDARDSLCLARVLGRLGVLTLVSVVVGWITLSSFSPVQSGTAIANDWAWMNPNPQANTLYGVSCVSPDWCMAVGDLGTILSWNGTAWTLDSVPTTARLYGVDCPSKEFCKAVGDGGAIVTWDGSGWTSEPEVTPLTLTSIDCQSDEDCKAVGWGGALLRWGGPQWGWIIETLYPDESYESISCFADRCKVVGLHGVILDWHSGMTWFPEDAGISDNLHAVQCIEYHPCYAIGESNRFLIWSYPEWSVESCCQQYQQLGLSCPASDDCKAVGYNGLIFSYDGEAWHEDTSPTTRLLRAVSCTSDTFCKAVGNDGMLVSWNGSEWKSDLKGPLNSHSGVDCLSPTLCKAVGEDGHVSSWNGAEWTEDTRISDERLDSISCVSTLFCKAVGDGGTIVAWDGSEWSADAAGTTKALHDVKCVTTSLCKAVGDGGTIRLWNGTAWQGDTSGTMQTLLGIDCPKNVFCVAVGENSTILVWNGTDWTPEEFTSGEYIDGVSCLFTVLCKAVTASGKVLTRAFGEWSQETPGLGTLGAISCSAEDACRAVGYGSALLSWDGAAWSAEGGLTRQPLNDVNCPTKDFCIAVGDEGTMLADIAQLRYSDEGFELNVTRAGCLQELVLLQVNENHPHAPSGVATGRYWMVQGYPGSCTSGFDAILTLPTTAKHIAKAAVCRYTGTGLIWDCGRNGTSQNPATVTRYPIGELADWAVGIVPIQVDAFKAYLTPKSQIKVEWQTTDELALAGFNVWRKPKPLGSSKEGKWKKLNQELIAPRGSGGAQGLKYRFKDESVKYGRTYQYKVEVIYGDGSAVSTVPVKLRVE